MVIRVKILETNKQVELDLKQISVKDLLTMLGLSLSEHIVLKNGEVITEEDIVEDNSEIVVFTVKSGG